MENHVIVWTHRLFTLAACSTVLVCLFNDIPSVQADERKVDFGREVQPLLAKRCFSCHGPDQAKGGLRLNRRESALAELDSGAHGIVPGKVDQSEIIRRITSTDEAERMPPEGAAISAAQADLLRRWIAQGAKWEDHWAFQPVQAREPPGVTNSAWVRNPIDSFILSRLEENGLTPVPPADKIALLRRAYYDLTGLPPTPAEVDAFIADRSPDAYEKVLDRLLASPRYGERWARHWLDAVRFAETNSFERDGHKPHAWRYRDYVIRAFNEDKPYDQFIREQLAGDELPEVTSDSIIATGYYRLGLWDDEPADRLLAKFDTLDDLVSTTSQVFLGATLNCARCHDHKIDPFPQRDYYGMVAFFHGIKPMTNSGPNIETPLFETPASRKAYEAQVRDLDARRNEVQAQITALEDSFRTLYENAQSGTSKVATADAGLDDLEFRYYRDTWNRLPDFDNLKPETVGKLPAQLFDISPSTRNTAFGFVFTGMLKVPRAGEYTFTLDSDDGSRLIVEGQKIVEHDGIHGEGQPKQGVVQLKQGRVPVRLEYFQRANGLGLTVAWSGPGFVAKSLSARGETGKPAPNFSELIKSQGEKILGAEQFSKYTQLVAKLDVLKKETVPVEYALSVTENGTKPPETFTLLRGNPHVPGVKVEPAFPVVLSDAKPVFPPLAEDAKTSGRRIVLANWIASPDNRLTTRVMMNRLWQHHFGRGIVRSPNNFGQLGDRPTHPELLDWLAREFVAGGWRLKTAHKLIMTSNAYRMSSRSEKQAYEKDPTNDLFWRYDMRRLSAEEIRDSIHAVNGRLNLKMYGPGIYPEISAEVLAGQSRPGEGWGKSSAEEQARRSIYIHVKRSLITPLLSDFDFPDTDGSCAARFATTQPTQALGMLNGDFARIQAAEFAARLRREAGDDAAAQVRLALRLALCRPTEESHVQRGLALLKSLQEKHQLSADKALEYYCLTVLNLNEFVYLD
jgi:mono/diheme cytochrome c family protein